MHAECRKVDGAYPSLPLFPLDAPIFIPQIHNFFSKEMACVLSHVADGMLVTAQNAKSLFADACIHVFHQRLVVIIVWLAIL